MRVRTNNDTQTLTVSLTLGGAVQLSQPELWALHNGQDVKLADPQGQDESSATWSGLQAPGAGGFLDFTVYWNAFDPQHDHWVYAAIIEVTDQNGARLPAMGGPNPQPVPCEIGRTQPSFGRGLHAVFIQA